MDIVPSRRRPHTFTHIIKFRTTVCVLPSFVRRTLLHRRLFERGTTFLCLSCSLSCFIQLFTFSLVSSSLPFFSFIMSLLDPKIITKTTTATTSTRMKIKKGNKKIDFLPPPPPPPVGKKVKKVWLFYLRVWWFRNLNTCIPV